jgi:hypothetical protein
MHQVMDAMDPDGSGEVDFDEVRTPPPTHVPLAHAASRVRSLGLLCLGGVCHDVLATVELTAMNRNVGEAQSLIRFTPRSHCAVCELVVGLQEGRDGALPKAVDSWRAHAPRDLPQLRDGNDAPCPPFTSHGASIMLQ